MTAPSVPTVESRAVAILRLSSPRYTIPLTVPFVVGYLAGGGGSALYVGGGAALITFGAIATNVANNRADRLEDKLDYPQRASLGERAGYGSMGLAAVAGSILYVAGAIALALLTDVPSSILPIWLVMLVLGWLYSYGPRFKARTLASIVIMSGAYVTCFWVGWRYSGGIVAGLPMAVLILLARLSCPGAKDAPNRRSDDAIGFASAYWRLAGDRGRIPRLVFLVQPYVVAIALAATGVVHPAILLVLAVAPLGFVYLQVVDRASTQHELNAVRELSNVYQYLLLGGILLGVYPSPLVALLTGGALVWYVLTTRYAHTEPDLLASSTAAIRVLLR